MDRPWERSTKLIVRIRTSSSFMWHWRLGFGLFHTSTWHVWLPHSSLWTHVSDTTFNRFASNTLLEVKLKILFYFFSKKRKENMASVVYRTRHEVLARREPREQANEKENWVRVLQGSTKVPTSQVQGITQLEA